MNSRCSPVSGFAQRRISMRTKVFYALGALASGARDLGFNTFLLIFYNQVLGLPASSAGAALMLTLFADALFDPLLGRLSDGWHGRLGRRHPFLYAAAIPAGLAYYLLWNPPAALSGNGLFLYLLVVAGATRLLVSLFEVPFSALAAEFSADYDERTSLLTYANVFGWWGGLALAILAYGVFLHPTAADPTGMFNRHGYAMLGLISAIVLLCAMLVAAVGTHGEIPYLAKPTAEPSSRLRLTAELGITLGNPSLLALVGATILLFVAQGLYSALFNYIQIYFFALRAQDILWLAIAPLAAATLVLLVGQRLAAGRDKRRLAVAIIAIGVLGQPLQIVLRLLGIFPPNGSPVLLPILAIHSAIESGLWVFAWTLLSSMLADVVEDVQQRTGRRSEGLIFSARTFSLKAVSGLGAWLTGVVLAAAAFPAHARPGQVPHEIIVRLGEIFVPAFLLLGMASALLLFGYRITRAGHASTVERLATATGSGTRTW
jgi:Na+/melibiose symporter-like transporter